MKDVKKLGRYSGIELFLKLYLGNFNQLALWHTVFHSFGWQFRNREVLLHGIAASFFQAPKTYLELSFLKYIEVNTICKSKQVNESWYFLALRHMITQFLTVHLARDCCFIQWPGFSIAVPINWRRRLTSYKLSLICIACVAHFSCIHAWNK